MIEPPTNTNGRERKKTKQNKTKQTNKQTNKQTKAVPVPTLLACRGLKGYGRLKTEFWTTVQ